MNHLRFIGKTRQRYRYVSFIYSICSVIPLRAATVVMNNLNIVGSCVYPILHKLIAVRLRDRKGRAILCVALAPQSGDSSGTTLGVRSVALLHAKCGKYSRSLTLLFKKTVGT